jgi:hypothetical protein
MRTPAKHDFPKEIVGDVQCKKCGKWWSDNDDICESIEPGYNVCVISAEKCGCSYDCQQCFPKRFHYFGVFEVGAMP